MSSKAETSGPTPGPSELGPAAVSFQTIFESELKTIQQRRENRSAPVRPPKAPLTGLALSGGGIRSAAVCLGAIQALNASKRMESFDYISTVSGGGYIGTTLNVSLSDKGGGQFPFGNAIKDSPVVAHLRNYSNYLLPRDRSSIRNWIEAAVVVLRGLVANGLAVLSVMLAIVLLLVIAYPDPTNLGDPNFLSRLARGAQLIWSSEWHSPPRTNTYANHFPMRFPLWLLLALGFVLALWAVLKSNITYDRFTNDTRGAMLRISYVFALAILVLLFIDIQAPLILAATSVFPNWIHHKGGVLTVLISLSSAMAALGGFAGQLGRYIERTQRNRNRKPMIGRFLARTVLIVGALILPVLLWLSGALIYIWTVREPFSLHPASFDLHSIWAHPKLALESSTRFDDVLKIWLASFFITVLFKSNNYSLHWLYRDRLSDAFLVAPSQDGKNRHSPNTTEAPDGDQILELNQTKLWELRASNGPYPLYNCALNVQGSREANQRGRNADFFVFTPDYFGSQLTKYVDSRILDGWDKRLDLGAVMAISGAAASANMGSHTVRLLSPTLALLNIRLGYYLKNPRYVGQGGIGSSLWAVASRFISGFFLLIEMFNAMDENRPTVFLSDGGHIENLGIYELLRRKCGLIFAIDAEADTDLACGSLLLLERYARIDLGILITLPWEAIARQSREISKSIEEGRPRCEKGPHCAIGRIQYPDPDTPDGVLVYVKSSLTGDERDYVLDYARRKPDFPDEPTSDQFFSEEQFEMYRALGFHMVEGVFGSDHLSLIPGNIFPDQSAARAALDDLLPPATV